MKAVFVVPGPDGGVFEPREVPRPSPGPGEVLIAIRAAGLNRGELIARPLMRSDNPALRPMRAGGEFAGVIESLGDGVSGWRVGDRVMGRAPGSYAEYVVAHPRALMRIPDAMPFAEAASIPIVFITAHDAIVTNAATRPDESIVITAGPSGVGIAAIQIARRIGARPVIATTRSLSKSAALRELGATDVIDASAPGWPAAVLALTGKRGVDVIIDSVGGPMLEGNIRVLAIKGRLVSVGRNAGNVGDCNLDEVARKRVSIIGVTFRTRSPEESFICGERFAADFLDDFTTGALRPVVDKTFALGRLAAAHAYMLSDAQIGKIVVTM
ncbi:MAG: zinc-binding dehydrogenase [Candidatus Binatus sp.]|uniref:quinone oxidoreductase family protein n=1 Tax=Candidatus Binatus sp. TaxID=2811406 RepID=UPI002718C6FE|nr:zinc-binding dehydrogenase [Candidatus Binatus sp.]MDO8432802.1 zinc-binding dehydrogenase [Candidatus Binatus sp.]